LGEELDDFALYDEVILLLKFRGEQLKELG